MNRSRYLGLADGRAGLRGCLIEGGPRCTEPRPLYLNLTGGTTLHDTMGILEGSPRIAWATPKAADLPPSDANAETRRHQIHELTLPPGAVDAILRLADRIQGRSYHRAHLAAWLALQDSKGDWLGRTRERMALDWLLHLARVRLNAP